MHRVCTLFLGLGALLISAEAHANWYSGDPYTAATAWPQFTDNETTSFQELALTYDNFNWNPASGSEVVQVVGGHFHSFGSLNGNIINSAYWEIRTGMAHNVAGTLVASGTGTVTPFATSFLQGGHPVTGVNVDVPDFSLPAGNYWFGLAIGATTGQTGFFVASTTGANGIGGPLGDDLSIYFQSFNNGATITWNYTESAIVNNPPTTGFDPSYWINDVPEPTAMGAIGAAVLLGARRRKR